MDDFYLKVKGVFNYRYSAGPGFTWATSRRPPLAACLILWIGLTIFAAGMLPDYPHKIFSDKRISYCLLLLALAMDTNC